MNLEDDILICSHCEKKIRYERPLFCPHCGKKLNAADGLSEEDLNVQIYPWSRIVPSLLWVWVAWAVLVLPITFIAGRRGFAILSVIFILVSGLLILGSVFQKKKP